jgi:hypothetical protein
MVENTSSASGAASATDAEGDGRGETSTKADPSYRKVERRSREDDSTSSTESKAGEPALSDARWPRTESGGTGEYATVDVTLGDRRLDLEGSDDRRAFKKRFRLPPPDDEGTILVEGPFATESDHPLPQVAFVDARRRIRLYAGGRLVTKTTFDDLAPLPDSLQTVRPVRVVRDGTVQLLVCWTEPGEEDDIRYKAGIFKLIGSRFGRIFERTVAVRPSKEGELKRRGYFEFLRGDQHRYIRWTPADDEEQPAPDRSVILEWNHWEGVYRRPIPPPTAPDRES